MHYEKRKEIAWELRGEDKHERSQAFSEFMRLKRKWNRTETEGRRMATLRRMNYCKV